MGNRYVNVAITRQTAVLSQQGFGLPLVLSTDKDAVYKEYTDLATVGTDFGQASETYKLVAAVLGQEPKVETVAVFGELYDAATGTPTDLTAALDALVVEHNDFYYLVSTEQGAEEIGALSAWAAANNKLYFASTSDQTVLDTLEADRTVVLVHNEPGTYPAEAWIGKGAPKEIGSFTWTFKTLNGINPANYDSAEIDAIEAANGSTYIREGGVNITSKGVTTSGEYIDIIQGTDFLKARIGENVFGLLVRQDKVPYTTAGIAMVVDAIEQALKQAATQGIIATDENDKALYSVEVPAIENISANDKAARRLPPVNWTATVAGAIEDVDVNGVLTV